MVLDGVSDVAVTPQKRSHSPTKKDATFRTSSSQIVEEPLDVSLLTGTGNQDPGQSASVIGSIDLAAGLDAHPDDVPAYLNTLLSTFASSSSSSSTALTPKAPIPAPGTAAPTDLAQLDVALNDILTRLTLLSQDTSSALEQSISDISRTVPRLTYDLQFMRESAASLQSSLAVVQGRMGMTGMSLGKGKGKSREYEDGHRRSTDKGSRELDGGKVESEDANTKTKKSLEKLSHLDKLKTRMESARDILREAESWSTLESEITGFIASSEWSKAGARLAEASKSMVVFQSTPAEYDSRNTLLVSLQNELETALSASLKKDLEQGDILAVGGFYGVFEMVGREAEFRNLYFEEMRRGVLNEWAQFDGENFASFLPRWYASLVRTLDKEGDQVGKIFPHWMGTEVLATFLQTTLDSLSPSLQARLGSMADSLGPMALPELIKGYKATEEVATTIHGRISLIATFLAESAPSPVTPTTPIRPGPKKRSSSHSQHHPNNRLGRMASHLDVPPVTAAPGPGILTNGTSETAWETTLLESFSDLQTSYGNLERRYLLQLLRSESFTSTKKDVSALVDRANIVFQLAGAAITRCRAFTHGFGTVGLVAALGDFLAAFLDSSVWILDNKPVTAQDELDFGLDYSTEDWAAFQAGLKVLAVCRDMSGRLGGFEEGLYTALVEIEGQMQVGGSAGVTLLQKLTLNSAELRSLFSSLSSPRYPITSARRSLGSLTSSSQKSLQAIILAPLRQSLSSYPSLPVWSAPEKSGRKDGLTVPTFSLSPTDTIARVSEGLLNLLRVFEVYASDDALGFSLETLPYIDISTLRPAPSPALDAIDALENGASSSPTKRRNGHGNTPTPTEAFAPETVLSAWISSLALSLLSDLTKSTLPSIPRLTTPGAAQLASDLGYLSNAVRALDVEWDDLESWKRGAEVDEAGWRDGLGDVSGGGKEVWARIGRLRGWSS